MGAVGLIFGVIISSYVWLDRNKAFYYLTYYGEILVVMGVGKMAYHSPRPYMVSDEIKVNGCSTEFGHPSGHSLNSMTFCIGLLLDRIASAPEENKCVRIFQYIVAITLPIMVGFSRLYNGDHSMDQILYGWLLGLWLAFANHYLFRDFILDHTGKLLNRTTAFTNDQLSRFFWISTLIFGFAIVLMIIVF